MNELAPTTLIDTAQDEAARSARSDSGEFLKGLPIVEVGQTDPLNPDRELGFPHVLYHGTKSSTFKLDDTKNHRNSSMGTGARTGHGLYAASEAISSQFGDGIVVELIPREAHLIDLTSPEADAPLSDDFRDAYLKTYDEAQVTDRVTEHIPEVDTELAKGIFREFETIDGFVGKETTGDTTRRINETTTDYRERSRRAKLVREIAAQINTARMLQSLDGVTLREVFATHDPINGSTRVGSEVSFDISPLIDFLTAHGVDGAITRQQFGDEGAGESGVVFWKMDKLGDKETWEQRLIKAPQEIGEHVLNEAVENVGEGDKLRPEPSRWVPKAAGGWQRVKVGSWYHNPKTGRTERAG